jgi:hypothetical protein
VTAYDELIARADADRAAGRFKEAHITYGHAIAAGEVRNHYCRRMRGTCSRLVAEQRIRMAIDRPDLRRSFLDQAARWLAKSEANLSSAYDESPGADLAGIRMEQARTEEAIARFIELCGGDPTRRLSMAADYRGQGDRLAAPDGPGPSPSGARRGASGDGRGPAPPGPARSAPTRRGG